MSEEDLKHFVDHSGVLQDTILYENVSSLKGGIKCAVSGKVYIRGESVELAVAITNDFPLDSPVFFLLNKDAIKRLPHIEENNSICYMHEEDIAFNIEELEGIIVECLKRAVQTLEEGITGKNEDDFYNEFSSYWNNIKGIDTCYANVAIGDSFQKIKVTKLRHERKVLFACSDDSKMDLFKRMWTGKEYSEQYMCAAYVPLLPGVKIPIPKEDTQFSAEYVYDMIFNNISSENNRAFRKYLAKGKLHDFILLSLPQPNGFYSLFGLYFKNIQHNEHPLINPITKAVIQPYKIRRVDAEFLLRRGGSGETFDDKKVLVIGCGSVGSAICDELVKASVLNLDIVDKDIMTEENCYRHNCGASSLNIKKTDALKLKLELFYPHCNIVSFAAPIQKIIKNKEINFQLYDAIIIATGNVTINQYLMRFFRKETPKVPVLFSWLDPLGIGGHCLITNLALKGCYKCLYTNEAFANLASFTHINQTKPFTKNISGCTGVFVPYSSMDATQTAILAVRKLTGIFSGKENENAIYSWKGDADMFIREGYNLSKRYFIDEGELNKKSKSFSQDRCSVCG